MITKDGFQIEYRDQVVTITRAVKDPDRFDGALERARLLLCRFKANGGSEWGCDGVGYEIQRKVGLVRVNKSGVSKKSYLAGCAAISSGAEAAA